MRVVERVEPEEHFSEGEPDLEPPEELAVAELDDDTLLEEDLDSEIVLEQDVDEDTLEVTLEDLVHLDDEEEDDDAVQSTVAEDAADADELEELDAEALDVADVEESLDRILQLRMAAAADGAADEDDDGAAVRLAADLQALAVAPCRTDEFVCAGCFLVRSRVLLADASRPLCRDCAG